MADKFPSVLFEPLSLSPQELEIGRLRQEWERAMIVVLASVFQVPTGLIPGPATEVGPSPVTKTWQDMAFLLAEDEYTQENLERMARDRAKRH